MGGKAVNIKVPLDVPPEERLDMITQGTGRLCLFAGDQKVEHLNDDFYGPGIAEEDADPEHLFKIASRARIGAFASQAGLIMGYGMDYPDVPYIIKLNSKTHLVKRDQRDPLSTLWITVEQVYRLKEQSGLKIAGVGYTIYPGSEFEHIMFHEAAQTVYQAHQRGLVVIIWAYPRGKSVEDEYDPHLIAGACGVAACLGADFVKVNYPRKAGVNIPEAFKEAVLAAGRTRVICAGGYTKDPRDFLEELYQQIYISGARGNATGRNIHQKPLEEAVRFTNVVYAVTVENKTPQEAYRYMGA